jgi:hypothetical protein
MTCARQRRADSLRYVASKRRIHYVIQKVCCEGPPLLHIVELWDTNLNVILMRQVQPMVGQTFVA